MRWLERALAKKPKTDIVTGVKYVDEKTLTRVGFPDHNHVLKGEIVLKEVAITRERWRRFAAPKKYQQTHFDIAGVFFVQNGRKYRFNWISEAMVEQEALDSYINLAMVRICAREKSPNGKSVKLGDKP